METIILNGGKHRPSPLTTVCFSKSQTIRTALKTIIHRHHKVAVVGSPSAAVPGVATAAAADGGAGPADNPNTGTRMVIPIGLIESVFVRLNGTPRQGAICPAARARLKLTCFPNAAPAADGLAGFSHVWVIFLFHKNKNAAVKPKVAPPKLNGARVGVFSTRAPYRPNPIGLSLARLDRVDGDTLYFSGLDLIDGTPVLDVKPHIPGAFHVCF